MIQRLVLENFRCHQNREINFKKGLNIILGKNGVGKTTVLEACELIYENSVFTNANVEDLVQLGSSEAKLQANLCIDNEVLNCSIHFQKNKINKIYTPSVFSKTLNKKQSVVTLCREDFNLVSREYESKRKFLDQGSRIFFGEDFSQLKKAFNKTLKSRNLLLKNGIYDQRAFNTWTSLFFDLSEKIRSKRKFFIQELELLFPTLIDEIFGKKLEIEFNYIEQNSSEEVLKDERRLRTTLFGAHRDKLVIKLDNRDYRSQLSVGERKVLVYLLKISLMLCSIEKKIEPIFIIDDFSSELDVERRKRIISLFMRYASQVIISTTHSVDLEEIMPFSDYNLIKL